MRIILGLSFLFFLLVPTFIQAQFPQKMNLKNAMMADSTEMKTKSPKGALIRSAIIPGWGQAYNNNYLKALVYFGGEVYFASRYISLDDKVQKMKDDGIDERIIEDKEDERNGWMWLIAAGYLLSLGDAYVDAHLYGLDTTDNLSIELNSNERERSFSMQLSLKF